MVKVVVIVLKAKSGAGSDVSCFGYIAHDYVRTTAVHHRF